MIDNLFYKAIKKNETADFFRGRYEYFVPSSDYEGHVHGAHMGGSARVYAESSKKYSKEFDSAFINFINSLVVTKDDLTHLLANLSSYFAQKSRGAFYDSNLFSSFDNPESVALNIYFNQVWTSEFSEDIKVQVERHAKFIDKKGYHFLIDIISNLDN